MGVAPHAPAGDLHLPRSTMDVTVPGMAASSSRTVLSQLQTSGLASTSAAASPSGGFAGGAGGLPRQPGTPRRDDVLDDTFIDVRLSAVPTCILH